MPTDSQFDIPAPVDANLTQLAPIARLLYTPDEASTALRIGKRLLWSKTKAGEIPCIRIGKCVRYDPRALLKFIEDAK
jgi:hypothetical protein